MTPITHYAFDPHANFMHPYVLVRVCMQHVYVVIRDRSVNWRRIRLEECLNAVDSLKPAEMGTQTLIIDLVLNS